MGIYEGGVRKAVAAARASRDGECVINGAEYRLVFDHVSWVYQVTDQDGAHVVRLNVRGLRNAKRELAAWLAS